MILQYPDERLRVVCKPVTLIDEGIQNNLNEMINAMSWYNGQGLAAPQLGLDQRLIIVRIPGDKVTYELINPELVHRAGEQIGYEGCLSLPGVSLRIKRFNNILVKALDKTGTEVFIHAAGHLSMVLQHEIDHLDGILILDRIPRIIRSLTEAKYFKLRRKLQKHS